MGVDRQQAHDDDQEIEDVSAVGEVTVAVPAVRGHLAQCFHHEQRSDHWVRQAEQRTVRRHPM